MAKKTKQAEIKQILWEASDSFRGKLDPSIYKDYILVMFFIKYLSDSYKENLAEYTKRYDGNESRIQRAMDGERFIVGQEATFDYLYSRRNAPEIGEEINKALNKLEDDNPEKLRNIFRNIDFNNEAVLGQAGDRNAMLKTLLEDFKKLDLRPSVIGDEDIIGNSYQFMIERFASHAGKKGGDFPTPSMVSELLARLVKPRENDRVYDPTCGSGSLLIRVANQVANRKVAIYGQERDGQAHSLSKINMFLHGIDDAKIEWGDTLANPLHLEDGRLMKFQVIVANPPFSLNKWAMGFAEDGDEKFRMNANLDSYGRFEWGLPPASRGDYAFVQHMLYSLAEDGRMATILPHGVLFRGGSERKIRKQIIEMNLLDAVIGLPEALFYGTGIPVCIMVFKKNRTREDVLFIDASGEGNYGKVKNHNQLREKDLEKIVASYENYETIDKYSYLSNLDEIKENDYNLNIPRYVDTFAEEPVDMEEVVKNIRSIKGELEEVEKEIASLITTKLRNS